MPVSKERYEELHPQKQLGRKEKPVDEVLLKKLSKLQLSDRVLADCVGVSVDTLHRRYAEQIDIWRSESKGKIAEVVFDEGINRRKEYAVRMLAHKHLDYADKVDKTQKLIITDEIDSMDMDDLERQIKRLSQLDD